jgi:hypothetical protein
VYDPRESLELALELLRGGALEGIVSHGPELDPSGLLLAFHRGDGDLESVRLGPDGRFRLEGLTPGTWDVRVLDEELAGHRSNSSSSYHDAGAPPFEPGEYVVVDGETTHCALDLGEDGGLRARHRRP